MITDEDTIIPSQARKNRGSRLPWIYIYFIVGSPKYLGNTKTNLFKWLQFEFIWKLSEFLLYVNGKTDLLRDLTWPERPTQPSRFLKVNISGTLQAYKSKFIPHVVSNLNFILSCFWSDQSLNVVCIQLFHER